jgi:hypothetical protein
MVIHIGDRLLTVGASSWDPLANKSVVLLGLDGFAVLSYSGLAYIDSKPTDQWLAEEVSGREAGPALRVGSGPPMMFDPSFRPKVGPALARVRTAIDREFGPSGTKHRSKGMRVEATGFIVPRRRSPQRKARPFMHRYSHPGHYHSQLVVDELPRYWDWFRETKLGSVGVVAAEERRALHEDLSAQLASTRLTNQDDCERLLVNCIRAVSVTDGRVGKHCMSIVLGRDGEVRVRFLPDPTDDSSAVAYTPWVVGPGAMWPPSVLEGMLPELGLAGYRVEFARLPPLRASMPLSASSQRRKPFN